MSLSVMHSSSSLFNKLINEPIGVTVSTALSKRYPIPVLIKKLSSAEVSLTFKTPYSPYKFPDLHMIFIDEHWLLNIIFFGARVSSFADEEYKLQCASIGSESLLTVTRFIFIGNSLDWIVAHEDNMIDKTISTV